MHHGHHLVRRPLCSCPYPSYPPQRLLQQPSPAFCSAVNPVFVDRESTDRYFPRQYAFQTVSQGSFLGFMEEAFCTQPTLAALFARTCELFLLNQSVSRGNLYLETLCRSGVAQGCSACCGSNARWRIVGLPCGQFQGECSWDRCSRIRRMVRRSRARPIMIEERQAREASMARTLQRRGRQGWRIDAGWLGSDGRVIGS